MSRPFKLFLLKLNYVAYEGKLLTRGTYTFRRMRAEESPSDIDYIGINGN